jgi:hypothetical protein
MTLIIANRAITGQTNLSDVARLALATVDGGIEWVQWAVQAPGNYAFSDESRLLDGVQRGLHGTACTLLPNLQLLVGPVKLMTLGPADLRTLLRAETDPSNPVLQSQLQTLLSNHRLVTATGFQAVRALLASLNLADNPLFQVLDLQSLTVLHAMMAFPDAASNDPVNQAAASFAVTQARSPAEFADYYTAFLGYVTRLSLRGEPAERQTQMATTAMQTLLPLLFGALDCPSVGPLAAPGEVAAAVQDWLRRGNLVGFARLSEACANIMIHSNYAGGNSQQAQQTIQEYLGTWQAFLQTNPPRRGLMEQDGATCRFPLEGNGLVGELVLSARGNITTVLFRRQQAHETGTNPVPGNPQ